MQDVYCTDKNSGETLPGWGQCLSQHQGAQILFTSTLSKEHYNLKSISHMFWSPSLNHSYQSRKRVVLLGPSYR